MAEKCSRILTGYLQNHYPQQEITVDQVLLTLTKSNEDYWKKYLIDNVPSEIYSDHTRTSKKSFETITVPLLEQSDLSNWIELLDMRDANLAIGLTTVFGCLVHRYTRQDEVVMGIQIVSNSKCFQEPLVLKIDLSTCDTFVDLLEHTKSELHDNFLHSEVLLKTLEKDLNLVQLPNKNPFFLVGFVYIDRLDNYQDQMNQYCDIIARVKLLSNGTHELSFEYNKELYSR